MTDYTPGSWETDEDCVNAVTISSDGKHIADVFSLESDELDATIRANASLIAAAPDLFEAALRLEMAELAHANCQECEGEEIPELCPVCFPLFDDARTMRRLALEKARGRSARLLLQNSVGDHG